MEIDQRSIDKKLTNCYWQKKPVIRKIPGMYWYKKFIVFDTSGTMRFDFRGLTATEVKVIQSSGVLKLNKPLSKGTNIKTFDMVVPKGFNSDSTSLPYANDLAGDGHDVGYAIQGSKFLLTKAFWDRCYYFLNLAEFSTLRSWIRWKGVVLFGNGAYRTRRAEKYQAARMQALSGMLDHLSI